MNAAPIWTSQSLRDVHERPDKGARVRAMFARIARRYDLNNHLHSLGRDRVWRRLAGRALGWYVDRVMPITAGWIAGDRTGAYRYLSASVGQFASAEELNGQMRLAGLVNVTCRKLAMGLAAIHLGVQP